MAEAFAVVALAASAFLAGTATGHNWATKTWQPRYEAAIERATKAESEVARLTDAVRQQNDAVQRLKAEDDARTAAAREAIQRAAEATKTAQAAAQRILAARPPKGADECEAARLAFDAELQQERGL